MGFSELWSYENQLTRLKNDLSAYKTDLEKQKKRKKYLEDMIKSLTNVANGKSSDVNTYLNRAASDYCEALKGVPKAGEVESEIRGDHEDDVSFDGNLSEANNYLKQELAITEDKIYDLEGKIIQTQNDISDYENAIRNERRNIAWSFLEKRNSAARRYDTALAAYQSDPSSVQLKNEYDRSRVTLNKAEADYNTYRGWLG